MPIYAVQFSAVAVSAAQDVFELATPASSKIKLRRVVIGQYSDFGDAQAELISIQIIRGNTVTGSGGTAATPALIKPWGGASVITAAVNNTTPASGGSPITLISDTFNVAAGWVYNPPSPGNTQDDDERVFVNVSSRVVVRITAPADALTMNGYIVFEEIGQ